MTKRRSTAKCALTLCVWIPVSWFVGEWFVGTRTIWPARMSAYTPLAVCALIGAVHAGRYRGPNVIYLVYGTLASWPLIAQYTSRGWRLGRNTTDTEMLRMAMVISAYVVGLSLVCRFAARLSGRWSGYSKFPAGHCQTCGYDLTGNVSGRCPECGRAIERFDAPSSAAKFENLDPTDRAT